MPGVRRSHTLLLLLPVVHHIRLLAQRFHILVRVVVVRMVHAGHRSCPRVSSWLQTHPWITRR